MDEKKTSRIGVLIRKFRISANLTQKDLAERCGLNESTIRNYELGNRYPDEATLLNIANHLGVSYFSLSDPNVENVFSALHILFDIEHSYGLRPTLIDDEVVFKFDESLTTEISNPQEDIDTFKKMIKYWAILRYKLDKGELSENDYYMKQVRFPANPINDDTSYSVSLDLDDDEQLSVHEIIKNEEVAEALKDLFPDFSYVKRKRKPKKGEQNNGI